MNPTSASTSPPTACPASLRFRHPNLFPEVRALLAACHAFNTRRERHTLGVYLAAIDAAPLRAPTPMPDNHVTPTAAKLQAARHPAGTPPRRGRCVILRQRPAAMIARRALCHCLKNTVCHQTKISIVASSLPALQQLPEPYMYAILKVPPGVHGLTPPATNQPAAGQSTALFHISSSHRFVPK